MIFDSAISCLMRFVYLLSAANSLNVSRCT